MVACGYTTLFIAVQLFRLAGSKAAHLCATQLLREVKFRGHSPGVNSWELAAGQYQGPQVLPSMLMEDGERFGYWASARLDFLWAFGRLQDEADSQVNHYKFTGIKQAAPDGWHWASTFPHVEVHTNSRWFGAPGLWVQQGSCNV
jgi:hypothetical protein